MHPPPRHLSHVTLPSPLPPRHASFTTSTPLYLALRDAPVETAITAPIPILTHQPLRHPPSFSSLHLAPLLRAVASPFPGPAHNLPTTPKSSPANSSAAAKGRRFPGEECSRRRLETPDVFDWGISPPMMNEARSLLTCPLAYTCSANLDTTVTL